jgi:dTDP-4-dehydrorhamnose reductase
MPYDSRYMRIALLGANGQLGSDLSKSFAGHDLTLFTRDDFEVTDNARAREILVPAQPEVIVNTTAYHRVDDCESQPEVAYATNVLAVLNLARIANDIGARLVHFSTDYVFDGASAAPYTEASAALPLSVYGNSKLAGEFIVRSTAKDHLVIRTCGLYGKAGSRGKGGNFVEIMLAKARAGQAIRVVADQVLTPTSTASLATQVRVMIERGLNGLFHATDEGSCSWHEFAAAIFEIAGVKADLSPTTSELYRSPAKRPRYSVLENARLKGLGLNRMPHWRDALSTYLQS